MVEITARDTKNAEQKTVAKNAIVSGGKKFRHGLSVTALLVLAICPSAFSRPVPAAWQPTPMKRPPAGTNSAPWHTITVMPPADLPKIHFYNKLNPVWWFGNIDNPAPPEWYRPHSKHRTFLWHLRNPFHNFDHYVIGVADKVFKRSGRWPRRNSNPNGGWDFDLARRRLVLLPFFSYERNRFNFYFGWRERGDFGVKLNFPNSDR